MGDTIRHSQQTAVYEAQGRNAGDLMIHQGEHIGSRLREALFMNWSHLPHSELVSLSWVNYGLFFEERSELGRPIRAWNSQQKVYPSFQLSRVLSRI